MSEETDVVHIYSDGSVWPNPDGSGGWAFVGRWKARTVERCGHLERTTNNEAELTAVLKVLLFLKNRNITKRVYLTTDSQYVLRTINTWRHLWKSCGWKNSVGKPVANRELIEQIGNLWDEHRDLRGEIHIHWTKGHAGDALNEMANTLAGRARTEKLSSTKDCEG